SASNCQQTPELTGVTKVNFDGAPPGEVRGAGGHGLGTHVQSERHPRPPHAAASLPSHSSEPSRTPLPHPPMVVEVVVLVVVVGHADPAGRGRQNRLTASMAGSERLAVAGRREVVRPVLWPLV